MKKTGKPEQSRAGFNNAPFRALKTFKPKAASGPDARKQPSERKRETEDEDDLFRRAVAGARPLSPDAGTPVPRHEKEKTHPPAAGDRDETTLFLEAMMRGGIRGSDQKSAPESEFETDENLPRSSSSRLKQLRRGTIRISAELDLHGLLREQALARLDQFVHGAYRRGQKAVLIITGKGNNSPDGPVLRGAVDRWLREKAKGVVAEIAPAPRDRGGSGAVVVFLKTRP